MRVFIELPTWLGDAVMATPAIENFLNELEKPNVTFIGSPVSIELFNDHPLLNQKIVLTKDFLSMIDIAKNIGEFDYFVSFRSSIRSKLFGRIIRSKHKYYYSKRSFTKGHQVERYNSFINRILSKELAPGPLKVYLKDRLKKSPKKTLGINPGATYGSAKIWPYERFSEVAIALSKKFDIYLLGGKNEINIANEIEKLLLVKGIKNFTNLSGKTSVNQLMQIIENLDIFITGDSGPMHIAAAFNIPSVCIFGPTKQNETSQWGNFNSVIVSKKLNCQPCMKRTCPLKHNNCMNLIESKDVINATRKIA